MPFRSADEAPGIAMPVDPLARFDELLRALDGGRGWMQDKVAVRLAAITLLVTPGDANRLAAVARSASAVLAERLGWFSGVDESVRLVIAAQLIKAGEHPDAFVDELARARELFRAEGLRRAGVYEVLAVLVLRRLVGEIEASHVAALPPDLRGDEVPPLVVAALSCRHGEGERLVLVDGTWLVYRAFFAIPANLATKSGLPTNAIFGFATMFRKLFAGRMPDRGAVVFDSSRADPPRAALPGLQGPAPVDAGRARAAARHHRSPRRDPNRFPLLRKPGYEADDIIATLARRGAEAGLEVVIVAGDKDLAQMVGEHVRMQDTMRDVTYDAELVRKKWGVPARPHPRPARARGRHVDNIPGVPGIGDKGAAGLLEKYGSLDGVLANLGELKGKQKAALEQHREAVKLYRELATVDVNAELDVTLDALRLTPPDPQELDALYRELEFYSLLSGGGAAAGRRRARHRRRRPRHRRRRPRRAGREACPPSSPWRSSRCSSPPARVHHAHLVGVALASDGRKPPSTSRFAARAPRSATPRSSSCAICSPTSPPEVRARRQAAGDPLHAPRPHARRPDRRHDDRLVPRRPREVHPARPRSGRQRVRAAVDPRREVSARQRPVDALARRRRHRRRRQVRGPARRRDPRARAGAAQAPRRGGPGRALGGNLEHPLAHVLARMELAGIRVDRDDLARMSEEFNARKAEIEKRIYALAGHEFNIGSTKQLADVLFESSSCRSSRRTRPATRPTPRCSSASPQARDRPADPRAARARQADQHVHRRAARRDRPGDRGASTRPFSRPPACRAA
jgi:DNA polymerase-1